MPNGLRFGSATRTQGAITLATLAHAACIGGIFQNAQTSAPDPTTPAGTPTVSQPSTPGASTPSTPSGDANRSQGTAKPVASPYAAGSILPTATSQADLDAVLTKSYNSYKTRFITQAGCASTYAYVNSRGDTAADGITVSEAHGYGMLILALMGPRDPAAQGLFDKMVALWRAAPSAHTPGLMAWKLTDGCQVPAGTGSAADGDLDMAYALFVADKVWGSAGSVNYAQLGKQLAASIMQAEIDSAHGYIVQQYDAMTSSDTRYGSTRLSDAAMLEHFSVFAKLGADNAWQATRATSLALIDHLQTTYSPQMGVVPDFAVNVGAGGQPAAPGFLESPNDGNYFYNACRVPWRLAMDFLLHNKPDVLPLLARMNKGVLTATAGQPMSLAKGYTLSGSPIAAGWNFAFLAPFAVGAMTDSGNQKWLDALWQLFVTQDYTMLNYYDASIAMLCLVVLTGHWPVLFT